MLETFGQKKKMKKKSHRTKMIMKCRNLGFGLMQITKSVLSYYINQKHFFVLGLNPKK